MALDQMQYEQLKMFAFSFKTLVTQNAYKELDERQKKASQI